MTVHLIKLSVGPESLVQLASWQKKRLLQKKLTLQKPELIHITKHKPKRAEELLDGGSIYWVIKGRIVARQKLLELRTLKVDGVDHCGLVYDKKLIRVQPQPRRPFQGWRYLETKDAPPDVTVSQGNANDKLQRELMELGLI